MELTPCVHSGVLKRSQVLRGPIPRWCTRRVRLKIQDDSVACCRQTRGCPGAPGLHAAPGRAIMLDVMVIGGGQAGLALRYVLQQAGVRFQILEASGRVGDA